MSNILALDISLKATGWAYFENGVLKEYGVIPEPKYAGKSVERYPQRTAKVCSFMSDEIMGLVKDFPAEYIIIEEVSTNGKMGVKSIKSLCMIHGILLDKIFNDCGELGHISMVSPSGKDGWRTILGLKKNGDWKRSAVKMANSKLNLKLKDREHDVADAILLGYSQIVEEK